MRNSSIISPLRIPGTSPFSLFNDFITSLAYNQDTRQYFSHFSFFLYSTMCLPVFTFKINYILLVYIFQAFFIVYFKEQEIIQKDRKNSTRMITIPVYWKQPEEKP